jgi:hypothetical protein
VAREDLVDRLSEVAKQRGYSLYAMVNEVLELAVKAEETGIDLKRVVEEGSVLKAARDAGFILGVESLWNEMAELAYQKAKTQALKSWYEAGVWLAKRYATGEVEDPFETFKKDLEAFTWNAPEFTIEKAGEKVSVRIISPRFTESYTALFTSFLEGALDAFGYKTTSKEISRGTIRLEAFKEEEADAPA